MAQIVSYCFKTAINGSELTAALCYYRKQNQRWFMDYKYGFYNRGAKSNKRVLVLVGKIFDELIRNGICIIYGFSHGAPYIREVSAAMSMVCAYFPVKKFNKLTLDSRRCIFAVKCRYFHVRKLLLAWKKGTLAGFPKDVIRYIANYLTEI